MTKKSSLGRAKRTLEYRRDLFRNIPSNHLTARRLDTREEEYSRAEEDPTGKIRSDKSKPKHNKIVSRSQMKRADKKHNEVMRSHGMNWIAMRFAAVVSVSIGINFLRFFSTSGDIQKTNACIQIISLAVDMYGRYSMLHVMVLESLMVRDPLPIMHMPVEEYYKQNDEYIRKNLYRLEAVQGELNRVFGESNAQMNRYMSAPSCDVIANQGFLNCSAALGGAANVEASGFYRKFLEIGGSLFRQVRAEAKDAASVASLLKMKEVASLVAFLNRGELGMHDAFYYYLLLPSTTALQEIVVGLLPSLQTANIISGFGLAFLFLAILQLLWRDHRDLLAAQNQMIFALPICTIESSVLLNMMLIQAGKKGKFNMIDN